MKKSMVFVILTLLTSLMLSFQNCGQNGFKATSVANGELKLSSSAPSLPALGCSFSGRTYAINEQISGYTMAMALAPQTCGTALTATCQASGKFDSSVLPSFSDCAQMCLNPDTGEGMSQGEIYYSYTQASGATQAECDATKVASVCQSSGDLLPTVPASRFATCRVLGQVCAYTSGVGTALPTGNMAGATVNGFKSNSATFPKLCGQQVTSTCQASGTWSDSTPLYNTCAQRCLHPDLNSPVNSGTNYNYYKINSGTQAQCDAALVAATCSATTGTFGTLPGVRYSTCAVTAPPPAQSHTVPVGPDAGALNIVSYGAVGDGVTDCQVAIQNALDAAAKKGVGVFVPAGVFAHSKMLEIRGVKVNGTGNSSVLLATNADSEPLHMTGNKPIVANVKVLIKYSGPRLTAGWNTAIWIDGATNFQVDHVYIDGSSTGGIHNFGGSNGLITNNTVVNTLADAIHNTYQASFTLIDGNYIENCGDDGIAVVSYLDDGGYTHDITATNNVIMNTPWGRNMSVVGGRNIHYENNYASGNVKGFACLYLASEPPSSWSTFGAQNVTVINSTFENCGSDSTGQGAIFIWGPADAGDTTSGINISNTNVIQKGQPGIILLGPKISGVSFVNYSVKGQGSDSLGTAGQIIKNTPWVSGPIGYTWAPAGVSGSH